MAGNTNPLSSELKLDTSDYKANIASANREMRVLESGFRASVAAMGDWSSSSTGLEMRISTLGEKMSIQERKVAALSGEYERVAAAQGVNSRAAQELLIKLNRETESLGKMESELKQSEEALDQMGNESKLVGKQVENLGEQQDKATKKTKGFGDALNKLKSISGGVVKMLKTMAVATGAVLVGMGGMMMASSDAASELVDMSAKTGISITQLQELKYVGGMVGVDLQTITGSLSRFTNAIEGASTGTGAMADDFAKLGLEVFDSNGEIRNSKTLYSEALTALGQMSNETERDIIAQNLFGKSFMELNPLIKAGAEELAEYEEEAHSMGAVMSEEAVMGLENFGDMVEGIKQGMQGTMGTLAATMLPAFQEGARGIMGYMRDITQVIGDAEGDLGEAAPRLGGILGSIFSDIGAVLPRATDAALNIINGLINSLITASPALASAALQILSAFVSFLGTGGPQLINAAVPLIMSLVEGLIIMLPQIAQAAVQIVLALARGIVQLLPQLVRAGFELITALIQGVTQMMPELIAMFFALVPELISAIIASLPALIMAAAQLIMAIAQGLVDNLPVLIAAAPELVSALVNAIVALAPQLLQLGIQLIVTLVTGIINSLPKLLEAGKKILVTVMDGANSLLNGMADIGKAVVEGIWNGISGAAGWLYGQISGFFSGLVQKAKDSLGISSPSKVFSGIGLNMTEGLSLGFGQGIRDVEQEVARGLKGLSGSADLQLGLAGANSLGYSRTVHAPVGPIYVNTPLDVEDLIAKVVRAIKS